MGAFGVVCLVLVTGCGPTEQDGSKDKAPTSTASASGQATSPGSTPSKTPSSTPSATPRKVMGKPHRVGNATIKIPRTWKVVLSDAQTVMIADQRRCGEIRAKTKKLPASGCALVVFASYSLTANRFPAGTPTEKVIKSDNCGVQNYGAKLAAGSPKLVETVEISGAKAEYYEQTICSLGTYKSLGAPYGKAAKSYVWVVKDRDHDLIVQGIDAPGVDLDLDTLRAVLNDIKWG